MRDQDQLHQKFEEWGSGQFVSGCVNLGKGLAALATFLNTFYLGFAFAEGKLDRSFSFLLLIAANLSSLYGFAYLNILGGRNQTFADHIMTFPPRAALVLAVNPLGVGEAAPRPDAGVAHAAEDVPGR